ncbi:outer membrane protein assembly factor BamD [Mucilaginibacter sp. HMF5004]|uniref:outer membrane protein assembly factor BamD n=1 Tax=Mucilaginibacter rivuli TaxID=2857527 RepID=UPI001C5D8331|nr:outer membrane protein assembly factor BamD [Mucilaginibacter rivuli]MBW4890566.1 outer membrane protein assembly factor BamD [Mucilaginibacter rivuli]
MFKKQRALIGSLLLVLIIALAGCKSKFEKLRTSGDVAKKYSEAIKYFNKKDYGKALELFDDLAQRYRGQAEAEDLFYYYAYTNYRLKDYTSARYHFKQFADSYPNSARAEECRFMAAYCFYLDSPIYSLDQENTQKAIDALQLFINLYPKSDRVAEASKLITDLRDKLEEKSYANAKLYLTIGYYQSAVIAFGNSLRDYPDTKYAEEMEFLTIKAQYLYAKNSLEIKQEERYNAAITFYEQFAERYPTSKYLKEAQNLKKDCDNGIQETKRILAEAETNVKLAKKIEEEKKAQPKLVKDTTAIKN